MIDTWMQTDAGDGKDTSTTQRLLTELVAQQGQLAQRAASHALDHVRALAVVCARASVSCGSGYTSCLSIA